MKISTRTVIDKIKNDYDNVAEYDDVINAWNQLCEQASTNSDSDLKFADVQKAALSALSNEPKKSSPGNIGHDVSRMINSFNYPAYVVTSSGHITASNMAAWNEFSLDVRDSIDQLPFVIDKAQKISELISIELKRKLRKDEPALSLLRAEATDNVPQATIALSYSHGPKPTALVFVLTTKWKAKSTELLRQQFNLTKTEVEILRHFVDGFSTQEIAILRERSHETIKDHFQSMREKLGAKNQTELLRTSLSVSEFTKDISNITNAMEHPHRRKAEQLLPSNRLVELTMMGDFSGDPFVMFSAGSFYTFNAEFEQMLYDANLLIISVCTPGSGATDPAPEGTNWIDQAGEDMIALLDQMGISKCGLVVKYTSAPASYHLARHNPSRFTHIVQISTCGPGKYDKPQGHRSPWVSGILKATINNSAIKSILIRGATKAWKTLGAKQFLRLQMTANPIDAKYALLPEYVVESEYALETASRRGLATLNQEQALVFGDWTEDIAVGSLNITAIHGSENHLFSVNSVRALASQFPEKMQVIEIEKAGFSLIQSHPAEVINILKSIVELHRPGNGCVEFRPVKASAN